MNAVFGCGNRTAPMVAPNCLDNIGSKFGVTIPFTTGNRSMRDSIRAISSRITPIQVIRNIVGWIAVFMTDNCLSIFGRLQKSLRDQSVHDFSLNLGISANRHLLVAGCLCALDKHLHGPSASIRGGALYSSKTGSRIFRRRRDYFPNFHSCNVARNKNKVK